MWVSVANGDKTNYFVISITNYIFAKKIPIGFFLPSICFVQDFKPTKIHFKVSEQLNK